LLTFGRFWVHECQVLVLTERTALVMSESLESVTPCKDGLSADFMLPFLRHTTLIGLGCLHSPDVKGSGARFPHLGL
jgi:hypothetical protein